LGIKILIINPWTGYIGPNTFFQQLAQLIIDRSYIVTVIYPFEDEISLKFKKQGVTFIYTQIISPIHYNSNFYKLINYMHKEINFYFFLKKINFKYDYCFINSELFSFSLFSLSKNVNKFNIVHSLSFTSSIRFSRLLFSLQKINNIANIAVSKIVMNNIKKIYPKSKTLHFYNGVNIDEAFKRKINMSIDAKFKILCVLHPVPHKGAHHLLDVLYKLKKLNLDFVCNIVGWDSNSSDLFYKKNIENKLLEYNLQDIVHLLPSTRDLKNYFVNANVFVHPSESESFGYVIAEAMSFELPVVAFDVGAISEIVKNNISGFLIQPFDTIVMAELIKKILIARDLNLDFGISGRKIICNYFNQKINMNILINYCLNVQNS
jgi:glycosyltransferase involved in cell wall biosynthesis